MGLRCSRCSSTSSCRARDLERWLIGHTLELSNSKVDLAKMRATTARYAPAACAAGERLFNTWLDGVSA